MALLYPWATKEYLLWKMSFPQIIAYHYIGMEQKYPQPKNKTESLKDKSYDELKVIRDEIRAKYGAIDG